MNIRAFAATLALVFGSGSAPATAEAQSFAQVDAAVRDGIRRGLYPGAVVVIGRRDSILYSRGYGHFTWNTTSPVPRPDSTLWDIASITKVVATTSAAMRLVDARRLELDAPVRRYLPKFTGAGKQRVTVRMLLDHTSGLPSYVPYYRRARSRDAVVGLLYRERLQRAPGDSAVYSDLNAMLLGLIVERVAGERLDAVAAREVFTPLGMTSTRFRPPASAKRRIAPNAVWRGTPIQGQVHDQNAARMNGVSGHAGVFSTGHDLARYAQMWLREGRAPSGKPWVATRTVRDFLLKGSSSGSRLLGWDSPEFKPDEPSVFGSLVSPDAYGHTGWTGTEVWIDPVHDLFLVFLTNRSFDPRARESLKELKLVRAEVSDAALRLVPRVCGQELVAQC